MSLSDTSSPHTILQHTATVCCSALVDTPSPLNTLQHTAFVCCRVQHTATVCWCHSLVHPPYTPYYTTLQQCVAAHSLTRPPHTTYYNTLQLCVAAHSLTRLLHTLHCNTLLQHPTLQHPTTGRRFVIDGWNVESGCVAIRCETEGGGGVWCGQCDPKWNGEDHKKHKFKKVETFMGHQKLKISISHFT